MKSKNSRTKNLIINSTVSILSQILTIILNFVLRTAFIKILGVEYTGISSVFTSILTMLSLSELGFATAISTALYQPLRDNNVVIIQQLMNFYKKAYRIVALFIFVVGLSLVPFLDHIIKDVPNVKENIAVIYIFYIIKTSASYLMIYKTTILKADQKIYVVKKLEMFCQLIRYAVEIVALCILRKYMTYLIIEVIATIIQNYVLTRRAQKEYSYAFEKPAEKLPRDRIISLFKDVKGLAVYKLSGSVGNSIDTILVSSFINTTTVGILGNYTLIKNQIQKLLMQVFISLTPSVGNLAAEKNSKKQKVVFDRLFYICFILVNFCSSSMFVLFTPFIKVWLGDEFLLNQSIAFIIAFDFFLYILLQAIASFRTANGLFVKGQYRPLITTILNIILSLVLIRKFGIFGTILATVIVRILTQWYDPYLLFKLIFKDSFGKFYLKYWIYIILFISGSFLTYFIANVFHIPSTILKLLYSAFVCVLIPNLWVALWTFKTDEFKYIKSLFLKYINSIRFNRK